VNVAPTVAAWPSRFVWQHALVAALAVSLLAGCTPRPDPYDVVATLGETDKAIALWVFDAAGRVVGNERRQTLEATRARPMRAKGGPAAGGGVLRRKFEVGPFLNGRNVLLTRQYKVTAERGFERLPSLLQVAAGGEVTIDYEIPGLTGDGKDVEIYSLAYVLPPAKQTFTTPPVKVAEKAVLEGSYGLDPASAGASTARVQFDVVAHADGAPARLLFSKVLEQGDQRSYGWSDYRVDLGDLAGKEVRFELRAGQEANGADRTGVALPVWSVPALLAPRPGAELRNVVLLSLDTLRADFVGAYGQELATTPNLDRFAAESALFEKVFTVYPSTTASHMTMLTGLYPAVHGIYAPGKRLVPDRGLLSTAFAARGYQTAAITEDGMLASACGFERDFRYYREYVARGDYRDGMVADVVDTAIAWLREHRNDRFFLFLHTYEVHGPYEPPPEYDVFKSYHDGTEEVVGGPGASEAVRSRLGYAGDLLYTDAQVARLLEALDELGKRDDTVVVITADHGEALGEHGFIGHNWFIIEPVLRIPLLIRAPGRVPEGLRIAAPASLVDLAPTILELAGLGPDLPMQGTSLVPLFADSEDERFRDRPMFIEKARTDGTLDVIVRHKQWKWISDDRRADIRYDLALDPNEDGGVKDAAALAPGQALMDEYRAGNDTMRKRLGNKAPAAIEVDDGTKQKLRNLGYIE